MDRVYLRSGHQACALGRRVGVYSIDGAVYRSNRREFAAALAVLGGYAESPRWSSDGRRIVFYRSTPKDVYPGRFGRNRPAVSQIVSMDVESGVVHELTSGPGLKIAPQWLTDGEVGFIQKFGDARGLALVSGQVGTRGDMRNLSWSADGKRVVYQKEIAGEAPRMRAVFNRDPEFSLFRSQ